MPFPLRLRSSNAVAVPPTPAPTTATRKPAAPLAHTSRQASRPSTRMSSVADKAQSGRGWSHGGRGEAADGGGGQGGVAVRYGPEGGGQQAARVALYLPP